MQPINFRKRLDTALERVGSGALIVFSQPRALRNLDIHHAYRQHSFMHYLLGFDEPNAALLLRKNAPSGAGQVILFLEEKDRMAEMFEGTRLGPQKALQTLPIDQAFSIGNLWSELPDLLRTCDKLFYQIGEDAERDRQMTQSLLTIRHRRYRARAGKNSILPVYDATEISGPMRLIKSPEEIDRIRQATIISARTFAKILAFVRPGLNERHVHGLILSEFLANGGDMEAYNSIVASGENAARTLHYTQNNGALRDGDLLLVDAGAQFEYYSSDVTRTFPIGKKFTPEQKCIYEIVLAAQLKALEKATLGQKWADIREAAMRQMIEGLVDLGFLKGSFAEIYEQRLYLDFCPAGTGHWLGMDVHDVGDYYIENQSMPLTPGMCFTVEPGIYIDPDNENVPPKFRGIGVRIEDDVLITEAGQEILTASIAKAVGQLENRI